MGMTTKSGKYFANPALGRAHESAEGGERRPRDKKEPSGASEAEKPEAEGPGGAHSVHIFRDETGGHHTVAHHPHGVEHEDHGSLDEAMDHAHRAMSGEEEPAEEPEGGDSGPNGLMGTLGNGSY